MASETVALSDARKHLQEAETGLLHESAEYHLEEGIYLLEERIESQSGEATLAANIGRTYVARFARAIEQAIEPRDVPEPTLRHLMRIARLLSTTSFAAGLNLTALTGTIAERYIDSVFEGYSPEEKAQAIASLRAKLDTG